MSDIHNHNRVDKQINNPVIQGNLVINRIKLIIPIIFLVLVILAFLCYQNWNVIESKLGWDKIFVENDSHFKILVLPFQIMCKDNPSKDIGKEITDRLHDLNLKDTLNIYPYYFSDYEIPSNFNYETAKQLQKYHNADQIIYGNYYDDQCTTEDGEEVCYNWITDEKWILDTLQQNIFSTDNYRRITMQDIRSGAIQGGTDYVLYLIAGATAFEQLNYSKALKYWLHIWQEISIQNFSLASYLGNTYFTIGEYQISREYYNSMIAFAESKRDTAVALGHMGSIFEKMGDYKNAEGLLEKALTYHMQVSGSNHPTVAALKSDLAGIYYMIGEYGKAQYLMEQVVTLELAYYGNNHLNLADSYGNLALIYSDIGNFRKAQRLLDDALKIYSHHLNENHPRIAQCKSSLANVHIGINEFEQARKFSEQALDSYSKIYGENHPEVARNQSNLAVAYSHLGQHEKAKNLMEKALESDLKNFGKFHPKIAHRKASLALVCKALKEYSKSIALFEQAIDIDIHYFGESHPIVANRWANLADVYSSSENFTKAEQFMNQALKSYLNNFGENHPHVAATRQNLAVIHSRAGEHEKAKELFEEALKYYNQNFGEDHFNVKAIEANLIKTYIELGETNKLMKFVKKNKPLD